MVSENDLVLFAGAGVAAYFLLYTEEGKSLLDGLGLGDLADMIDETITPRDYSIDDVQRWIDKESEYYFPIQDLYVPKGWPNTGKYNYPDPYRTPSKEWKDWYIKGAYGYPEDQFYPKHYNWNPDYYFYFGNMYKKWYPSAMAPDDWPSRERIYSVIPQTAWDFPLFPP